MTSFSFTVKEYICKKTLQELGAGEKERMRMKPCCVGALLSSLVLFLGKTEKGQLCFESENRELLEICAYILIHGFRAEKALVWQERGEKKRSRLILSDIETTKRLYKELGILAENGQLRFPRMSCTQCPELFIRGAFLSCGTVLNPKKGYHAAFTCNDAEFARGLQALLSDFSVETKIMPRKRGGLVYMKESTKIEDLLSLAGAQKFAIDLMNSKIEKDIRNNVNRKQNFDEANIKRSVNCAQSVISAIAYLEKTHTLQALPAALQEAARLRVLFPEAGLAELCRRFDKPITKSGLNHRLDKLCRLADEEKMRKKDHE